VSSALLVSVIALWIAVAVLGVVVVALTRQIGVLYERIAPAGALVIANAPKVGEAAPIVAAEQLAGGTELIGSGASSERSTLLFFLSPTCPVCKELLTPLRSAAKAEADWLRVVLVGDGERETYRSLVRSEHLESFDFVLSTQLGLAYQVSKLPYAVLLDAAGIVRASGLVNTREHLESLFEARERGVASIQEYVANERARAKVA
jgi:methylamine dehydrogenase accessory protein MauD